MEYTEAYEQFWKEVGAYRKMVLSTSNQNVPTSRMISVIIGEQKLYFQTDARSRKYAQIHGNQNVALCIDNIQIEGVCVELGKPIDNDIFLAQYRCGYPDSYNRYTMLEYERLFEVTPTYIERWKYIERIPYIETMDVRKKQYRLVRYE